MMETTKHIHPAHEVVSASEGFESDWDPAGAATLSGEAFFDEYGHKMLALAMIRDAAAVLARDPDVLTDEGRATMAWICGGDCLVSFEMCVHSCELRLEEGDDDVLVMREAVMFRSQEVADAIDAYKRSMDMVGDMERFLEELRGRQEGLSGYIAEHRVHSIVQQMALS